MDCASRDYFVFQNSIFIMILDIEWIGMDFSVVNIDRSLI